MADPLSIIALAVDLTPKIVRYILDVREGSNERRQLIAEISGTGGVLFTLQQLLKDPQLSAERHAASATLGRNGGPLESYVKLLESIGKALQPKNGIREAFRSLTWPFRKEEVYEYLRQIERYKSLFLLALELDQTQLARQMNEDLKIIRDGQDVLAKKTEELLRLRQVEDYEKVLQWISSFDYTKKHKAASSLRFPGTGTWILQSDLFEQWHRGNLQTLLCYGIPGAGKTILASSIIDYLLSEHAPGSGVGIAYLYCDHKDKKSQSFQDLFTSVLKQLIRFAPEQFLEMYGLHSSRNHDRSLSLDRVQFLSQEVIGLFDRVYIVIDALDESEEVDGTRTDLMSCLAELQAASGGLHILITSRPKQVVFDYFPGAGLLEISALDSDVQTYINERIKTERRLQRYLKQLPDLKAKILQTISSKCQGMFLLARLHLDSVSQARTLADLEDSLERLPDGRHSLKETYQEALDRIYAQEPRDVEMANKILIWLCFSARPLKADELRWVLAIDVLQQEEDFNEKRLLPEEDIVSLSGGLVTIDVNSKDARLVHYTAQEFFVSQRDTLFPDAKMTLFLSCERFLSYSRFNNGRCQDEETLRKLKSRNPFLEYAAQYLGEHAKPVEEEVKETIISLLRSDMRLDLIYQVRRDEIGSVDQKPLATPLATAIVYGLEKVAAELIASGADVNATSEEAHSPVHSAGYEGQTGIMEMLIANDANLHARDRIDNTALHAAAINVVRGAAAAEMILQRAPRIINYTNTMNKTALHDAAQRNNINVVKVLIAHNAFLDLTDTEGRTPLNFAVEDGHAQVVKLLLSAGADPSKDEDHDTLVGRAALLSSPDCLSLLLSNPNLDYLAHCEECQIYALHLSVSAGSLATTRLLLDYDRLNAHCMLDMQNLYGKTPLQDAAERGHTEIVQMLLAEGADPTVRDWSHRTALHWAARYNPQNVIQELLKIDAMRAPPVLDARLKRTDETADWPEGGTALQVAVAFGQHDAAAKLIEAGAKAERAGEEERGNTEEGIELGLAGSGVPCTE